MNTIVAAATPAGRGALSVVRLSGPEALPIARQVFSLGVEVQPRHTYLCKAVDGHGENLDEGLLVFFPAGKSFSGQDTIEFSGHGSPALVAALIQTLMEKGAKPARPGEFTWQAFQSGRIKLDQAEAINQLVNAESRHEARLALEQMHGALATKLKPVKKLLLNALAQVQASIDFVEDQDADLDRTGLEKRLAELHLNIKTLLAAVKRGALLHEGVQVVLAGRPNVGKSSLFNGLLSEDRALVTAIPGTTRDALHGRLEIGGLPITLVDTAGLRESQDQIEKLGIQRSEQAIQTAHLVCLVADGRTGLTREGVELWQTLDVDRRLLVLTHGDQPCPAPNPDFSPLVVVSNPKGRGWDQCLDVLADLIQANASSSDTLLMSHFQRQALDESLALIEKAQAADLHGLTEEALAADLELALEAFDRITGSTAREEVFDLVFSSFCIGK